MKLVLWVAAATFCVSFSVFADDGWKTESEAGVVLTSGNTETTTLNAKDATTYTFGSNAVKFTGGYLYQKTGQLLSAKAWSLGLRYERLLSERFGFFVGQAVEGDRFKGILQMYNTDLGAKYFLVKEDGFYWFSEGGYRFTRERSFTKTENKHFIRVYNELEKKWNAAVSTKYWLELLPNVKRSTDWQLNTELSLSAVLTSIFSIKTGYQLKFDHEPNATGLKKSDRVLTTALVAKF